MQRTKTPFIRVKEVKPLLWNMNIKEKVIYELKEHLIKTSEDNFGFIRCDDLDIYAENYVNQILDLYIGKGKDYEFAYENIAIFKEIIKYGLIQDKNKLLHAMSKITDKITDRYRENRWIRRRMR